MTKTKALKFTLAASKEGTLMKLSGTNYWAVAEPFFWYVDYEDHSKGMIMVPRGFNTDMGSIPRALWLVFNPTEWLAFVLHDYLYKTQVIEGRKIERIEADTIMKEALISE